jgi:predicted  nucleic acid-binding Zn-ribbon protein
MIQQTNDDDEAEKLRTIMLGAGLSEVAGLSQTIEEFSKISRDIGGKHGRPNVGRFKDYYGAIGESLGLRKNAAERLELYEATSDRLEALEHEIKDTQGRIVHLGNELTSLDGLKNNYEECAAYFLRQSDIITPEAQELMKEYRDMRLETLLDLRKRYDFVSDEHEKQVLIFRRNTTAGDAKVLAETLIRHTREIEAFKFRLSGLKAEIDNYFKQRLLLSNEKPEIHFELMKMNESRNDEFEEVLGIDCDALCLEQVTQDVDEYQKVDGERALLERELTGLNAAKERLDSELSGISIPAEDMLLKRYFYLSVLFLIIGSAFSLGHYWFGLIFAGIGIVGTGLYVIMRYFALGVLRERKSNLEFRIKDISDQQRDARDRFSCLDELHMNLSGRLSRYRSLLELREYASPSVIREYFKDIRELKKSILRWKAADVRLEETGSKIENDLRGLAELLRSVYGNNFCDMDFNAPLDVREELFGILENTVRLLDLAKALRSITERKSELESEIISIARYNVGEKIGVFLDQIIQNTEKSIRLNEIQGECNSFIRHLTQSLNVDVMKKALTEYAANLELPCETSLADIFFKLYRRFPSLDSVQKAYEDCGNELMALRARLEGLKDEYRVCSNRKEDLASAEKLERAQLSLNKARSGLRPLAEKFAVHTAAGFILKKVQECLVKDTMDTFLRDAGDELSKLTSGEYAGILPPDDPGKIDFKTVLADGSKNDTTEVLSRATREQLFLSIRLSKIRKVQPPLPDPHSL